MNVDMSIPGAGGAGRLRPLVTETSSGRPYRVAIVVIGWVLGPGAIFKSMFGARNPGAVGAIGVVLTVLPVAYWIWGMVDAKRLCDVHNQHRPDQRQLAPA